MSVCFGQGYQLAEYQSDAFISISKENTEPIKYSRLQFQKTALYYTIV